MISEGVWYIVTDLFKEILPSILVTGKPVEFDKEYKAYVVDYALSLHRDTIMQANEMNMYFHIPNHMQYDYLINKVRHYKRPYVEWPKKQKLEDVEVVKEYYNVSFIKAKEYLKLLSTEQLTELKNQLDRGGNI